MFRRIKKPVIAISLLLASVWMGLVVGMGYLFPDIRPVSSTPKDRSTVVYGAKIRYRLYEPQSSRETPVADKAVIVLVHGFGGSLDHWDKVVPLLKQHRVVALDLVGFGGSDRPRLTYNLQTQMRYLLGFLQQMKIERAVLVGSSMGASLTAWTAARSKEGIVGAVMFAPSGYPGSLKKLWPYSSFYKPGALNRVAAVVVNGRIFRLLFPGNLGPQAIGVTGSYNSRFAEALEDIRQPVLLVWSRSDDTSLFEYRKKYQKRIKNLEFIEASEKVGHAITRKDPAGAALLINNFMKKI